MNTDRTNATLRIFWLTLSISARKRYRAAWRNWEGYMARQGVEPTRVTIPLAQDWINSLARRYAPLTVGVHVTAVRSSLEYLAMMGHRPYEPLLATVTPTVDIRPPKEGRPKPTVERLVAGMRSAATDDAALGLMWATAGMGLAPREVARLGEPGRILNVGDGQVAVIQRAQRKLLVPVPREITLCIARSGWPMHASTSEAVAHAAQKRLAPHLPYTLSETRSLHLALGAAVGLTETAIVAGMAAPPSDGLTRWQFTRHPAVVICAYLRGLLACP